MTDVRVVLVTAPDEDTAARLARALLEEQLIACANLVPRVRSLYRWEGAMQEDAEVLMILKTTETRLAELETHVLEAHPYDTPEFVAWPITTGSQRYLDWVTANTATGE